MRKHINLLTKNDLDNLPLYSWECLSIETKHRTIDLVIKNQEDLFELLYFLISKIQTIDGNRGSANIMVQERIQRITKNYRKQNHCD
jgi:hypothetical protein